MMIKNKYLFGFIHFSRREYFEERKYVKIRKRIKDKNEMDSKNIILLFNFIYVMHKFVDISAYDTLMQQNIYICIKTVTLLHFCSDLSLYCHH